MGEFKKKIKGEGGGGGRTDPRGYSGNNKKTEPSRWKGEPEAYHYLSQTFAKSPQTTDIYYELTTSWNIGTVPMKEKNIHENTYTRQHKKACGENC